MLKLGERKSFISILLFVVFLCGLSGCTALQSIETADKTTADPELNMLSQAESAYFSENYALAEEIFATLKGESENAIYVNAAQYGIACINIATASNTDELMKGFAMLTNWQEPDADVIHYQENPKMIAVALNKQVDLIQCEPEIRTAASIKEETLLKESQKEVKELKSTIKKLEHQISVLEAIDQEIQEKRKP